MAKEAPFDPEAFLPLKKDAFHILVALADGDRHGYSIMREVAQRTDGKVRLSPSGLYGAIKWLSDDRNNSALPPEDSNWAIETWNPRVLNAGWKYWAVVTPEKVIGQLNLQRFVEMYSEMGVTVKVFTDADAALAWLKSEETAPAPQKADARP